jgi:ParB/Sulfiredoxin domain
LHIAAIRAKNDHAVERMAASIREFGFKIPILARSNGEVIDGHLRLKAAQKLGIKEVPVILCDEWSEAQVKAFRLMNRSVNWANWDEQLVALEIEELKSLDFDLRLTRFDPPEIDEYLLHDVDEQQNEVLPDTPEVAVARLDDLWLLESHQVLCGDATNQNSVSRLLGGRRPLLMVVDPPFGISLDSEWRDRAGLNGCGEHGRLKRTEGHRNTTILSDTRVDWFDAVALVPSLEVAYVWHASKFTREVLDSLLRIGFVHHQPIIWNKGRAVLTRTHYWFQHEPCWYVRKKNARWFGKAGENLTIWDSPSPKFMMGGSRSH